VPLFYFIFSNNVRKQVEATNDSEFFFHFPGKGVATPCKNRTFVFSGCMRLAYSFGSLLQSLLFAHSRHEYNLIYDFYTYADV